MAGADVEREEAGRVEERVDAQDDARVADLEVLQSALNRHSDETDVDRSLCNKLLSKIQTGHGRAVKKEQEASSRNFGPSTRL